MRSVARTGIIALTLILGIVALVIGTRLNSAISPQWVDAVIASEVLEQRLSAGDAPILVDVRTPREFAAGHIEGARNLPIQQMETWADDLLAERDREIVIYCEAGPRAHRTYQHLQEAGFSQLRLLEGHMRAWRAAGRPLADDG